MSTYFKLASEGVVWENIGGQIVIANLNSGGYCSISEKSGVLLWESLMAKLSIEATHQHFSTHFKNYDTVATSQVDSCLAKLIKLDFLSATKDNNGEVSSNISQLTDDNNILENFSEPKLLFYDDVDTLLQLDPIDDEIEELMKEYTM
jgi:hypothetical protein